MAADLKNKASEARNNTKHIRWLLTVVKQLQRDRDNDRAELDRLRKRIERSDSE